MKICYRTRSQCFYVPYRYRRTLDGHVDGQWSSGVTGPTCRCSTTMPGVLMYDKVLFIVCPSVINSMYAGAWSTCPDGESCEALSLRTYNTRLLGKFARLRIQLVQQYGHLSASKLTRWFRSLIKGMLLFYCDQSSLISNSRFAFYFNQSYI